MNKYWGGDYLWVVDVFFNECCRVVVLKNFNFLLYDIMF